MKFKAFAGVCVWVIIGVVAQASDALPHKRLWRNPVDGMKFVWVPAGVCTLEVPGEVPESKPEGREIKFDGFWMGQMEVTVAQFSHFAKRTEYVTDAERAKNRWTWRNPGFRQGRGHPVVYLSFNDALQYARWAGVDLPTDREWIYACRAGTTNRYYWGEQLDDRFVWHRANAEDGTRPVGKKRPNDWGFFDMVGNAWEYCKVSDCHPGHQCFTQKGSSWTRCPSYRTRQGFVAENLVAEGVEPRLRKCDPNPKYAPYPWDDDRGFRCIKRTVANPE